MCGSCCVPMWQGAIACARVCVDINTVISASAARGFSLKDRRE